MRVSESMLYDLKMLANRKDVPYQSLAKMLLDEKIREEMYASLDMADLAPPLARPFSPDPDHEGLDFLIPSSSLKTWPPMCFQLTKSPGAGLGCSQQPGPARNAHKAEHRQYRCLHR